MSASFFGKDALEKLERAYRKLERKPKRESQTTKKEQTPNTIRVSEVEREEVSWLWQHRIPKGKLTIIEGDRGEGKSFLSQAIATAVTRGFGFPGKKTTRTRRRYYHECGGWPCRYYPTAS